MNISYPLVFLFLWLPKNCISIDKNKAAGEREGARPASRYNNPPQKSLNYQAFWAKQRFVEHKTLGGRSVQDSPSGTFVSDEFGTEYMHLFTADRFQGQLKDCDEGELAWIKKAELLRLTMWEGDRIFLRLLDSDEPFFSLKLRYQGDKLVDAALNGKSL